LHCLPWKEGKEIDKYSNSLFVSLAISRTEINPSRTAAGSDDATDGHITKSTAATATASSALAAQRTVQPGYGGGIAPPPAASTPTSTTALLPVPTASSTWCSCCAARFF
jgi:hypothetical protein